MRSPNREQLVHEFHEAMSVYGENYLRTLESRMRLMSEEFHEVKTDMAAIMVDLHRGKAPSVEKLSALLKELCDLQYVLSGTADELGWTPIFDAAFRRVHASNMSKLDDNGDPVKDPATGKVLKGENYKQADLTDLVKDTAIAAGEAL